MHRLDLVSSGLNTSRRISETLGGSRKTPRGGILAFHSEIYFAVFTIPSPDYMEMYSVANLIE